MFIRRAFTVFLELLERGAAVPASTRRCTPSTSAADIRE